MGVNRKTQADEFGYTPPPRPVGTVQTIQVSEGKHSETLEPAVIMTLGDIKGHRDSFGLTLTEVQMLVTELRGAAATAVSRGLTPFPDTSVPVLDLVEDALTKPDSLRQTIAAAEDPEDLAAGALDLLAKLTELIAAEHHIDVLGILDRARRYGPK